MYNFLVLNKAMVENAGTMTQVEKMDIPYVMLSILSPEFGLDSVNLPFELENCKAHHTVLFHDVTKDGEVNSIQPITKKITPINKSHAKEMLEFIMKWKNEVDDFLIHCEAGMSRSPGAALAFSEILNGKDSDFEKMVQTIYPLQHHNETVKNKILEAYYGVDDKLKSSFEITNNTSE